MPKVDENHDCAKIGCKGGNFKGMKVECNQCDKIWFLQCLIDEDDMYELMKCVGMVKLAQENDDINKKTSVNDQKRESFNAIIGENTSIEYACMTCKRKGSTKNKIKSMEKEIERLNEKLNMESDKYKDLNKQYEKQSKTIHENEKVIQTLTKANEKLNEQNKNVMNVDSEKKMKVRQMK